MGVNKVDLSTGENLIDISKDTVTEDTLYQGVTAHNAQGEQITGRMTTGGGVTVSDIFWVTGEMDLASMTISNMSHTFNEVVVAMNENKIIKFKCSYVLPSSPTQINYAYGDIIVKQPNSLGGQIMVTANLGAGVQLYYFSVYYDSNNNVSVTPYIINTTAMGG